MNCDWTNRQQTIPYVINKNYCLFKKRFPNGVVIFASPLYNSADMGDSCDLESIHHDLRDVVGVVPFDPT